MNKDTETWRPIPSFPGYEASSEGRIRGVERKDSVGRSVAAKVLKNARDGGRGYLCIRLRCGGKTMTPAVHRLVLEAFRGVRPDGQQCRHRDGNKQNNRIENLIWGSSLENNRDKVAHGTIARHERNGFAKLDTSRVSQALRMRATGVPVVVISDYLGVNRNIPGQLGTAVWRGVTAGRATTEEQKLYREIAFWANQRRRHIRRHGAADARAALIAASEVGRLLKAAKAWLEQQGRRLS